MSDKNFERKNCKECGFELTTINFSAEMTEQWSWNGNAWECTAHNSLIDDPAQEVRCPECDKVVGTGKEFGF
ncbi:MAG: hypothetical protein NTX65_09645 [Ignavibacteriales bacterium]|nr:hypothetical protein [Ignavibacteriales bacterium]